MSPRSSWYHTTVESFCHLHDRHDALQSTNFVLRSTAAPAAPKSLCRRRLLCEAFTCERFNEAISFADKPASTGLVHPRLRRLASRVLGRWIQSRRTCPDSIGSETYVAVHHTLYNLCWYKICFEHSPLVSVA